MMLQDDAHHDNTLTAIGQDCHIERSVLNAALEVSKLPLVICEGAYPTPPTLSCSNWGVLQATVWHEGVQGVRTTGRSAEQFEHEASQTMKHHTA
jgi:hypothetical protein